MFPGWYLRTGGDEPLYTWLKHFKDLDASAYAEMDLGQWNFQETLKGYLRTRGDDSAYAEMNRRASVTQLASALRRSAVACNSVPR